MATKTFEFLIDPSYRLQPKQKENITKRVRVFRKSITQTNNDNTTLWECLQTPCNTAQADTPYYNTNTVDEDMDISGAQTFGDIDNEYEGLTIMDEREFRKTYCNGYAALVI